MSTEVIINRGYRFRVYPTKEQKEQISIELGHSMFIWNLILAYRIMLVTRKIPDESILTNDVFVDTICAAYLSNPTYYEFLVNPQVRVSKFARIITLLKQTDEFSWLKEATAHVLLNAVYDLDRAHELKRRGVTKKIKFKNKSNKHSIRYDTEYWKRSTKHFKISDGYVILPKLNGNSRKQPKKLKLRGHKGLHIDTTPNEVTLTKTSTGEYYISFTVPQIKSCITYPQYIGGVDVGIRTYVTTSDGDTYDNPKYFEQQIDKIRIAHKILSRKKVGSKNFYKQVRKLAKIYQKIHNQHRHFNYNIVKKLIVQYDIIGVETLDIQQMTQKQHSNIARLIANAGWRQFLQILNYKLEWQGGKVIHVNQFFPSSQKCSSCGKINRQVKDLSVRQWVCECGAKHDRDINAAINLATEAEKIWYGDVHRPSS